MPQYFFHIRSKAGLEHDDFGVELVDLQAVWTEAARTVDGFQRDKEVSGKPLPGLAFEVADPQGACLLVIPFGFASRALRGRRTADPAQSAGT